MSSQDRLMHLIPDVTVKVTKRPELQFEYRVRMGKKRPVEISSADAIRGLVKRLFDVALDQLIGVTVHVDIAQSIRTRAREMVILEGHDVGPSCVTVTGLGPQDDKEKEKEKERDSRYPVRHLPSSRERERERDRERDMRERSPDPLDSDRHMTHSRSSPYERESGRDREMERERDTYRVTHSADQSPPVPRYKAPPAAMPLDPNRLAQQAASVIGRRRDKRQTKKGDQRLFSRSPSASPGPVQMPTSHWRMSSDGRGY
ncbi:hypothetical protein KIPB_002475 [Kipferlia bialata]|uniref:Uncharacterized protein n=1 Tax=Kipferlia bialata TaxID=797122 RepID=A0A391NJD3_9EUKA|nr:hypothetical protein KIPB_002475 [Kipferlia bialata]|eukprot:g2475.t1